MIQKIKITSGFAKDLPICKVISKTKLSPGLNILWGENGSGKTTALQIAAAFTFCHKGGWTRLLEPLDLRGLGSSNDPKFPDVLANVSPDNCKAKLDWDKAPVFFANSIDRSRTSTLDGESDDGLGSMMDEFMGMKRSPKSSGQVRKFKLNTILNQLGTAPDFKNFQVSKEVNSTWQRCFQIQADFLADRPDNGRTTILMDEPERNLDAKTAYDFWNRVVPHLSKFAQVVIATHHPFALVNTDATWISTNNEHQVALKTYQDVFKP